jgi:hypothetical protein
MVYKFVVWTWICGARIIDAENVIAGVGIDVNKLISWW